MSSSLFCGFGDHTHCGDLSLGCRRYHVSALHPQASAEATLAAQAAPATQAAQAALAAQAAQATQLASCHSARLCIASGRQPFMNALVPYGTADLCYSAGSSV